MAIIKDPDGFCNVRAEANNQSKIEDTLLNGRLVYAFKGEVQDNWLPVDYHKGKQHLTGYIHRSRLLFLTDMTMFKPTVVKDTLLKLELNGMQFTIKTGTFIKAGRKIAYEKASDETPLVKTIDGKHPWGTDISMPRYEYRFIQFRSGAQTLTFPKTKFNDLFEPVIHFTDACLDKATNKIYLRAMNSDGAGGYVVTWVIKNGQIEHREEFIPF